MNTEPLPKCPQCRQVLPSNAPAGLCPNCLMALNFRTETTLPGKQPETQPPLPPDQIAPHFPQLEILEYLGRGGMGVVYKARQKTLNRLVALKLLAPERVNDPKFAERFTREAQALAALNHPNIVTIYDFGQAGGFYYLLMEFVDGLNLRHLLRARKFTPEEALAIVPPLCDALQFAHEHGIVHRDIKPENILLDKMGRVKVADFGIAKMLFNGQETDGGEPAVAVGVTQSVVGTPGYSAPEQSSDPKRVDSRADIYSLGVVFYEMLTGELPGKKIEPPSKKVQIDVRLDEVVLRALEKEPELRYQQASVFKTRVETFAQEQRGQGQASAFYGQGFEYKSDRTLFGLPLLHVANGVNPQTGRALEARGIVALGGIATGVIAIGGRAYGILAFGGIAGGVLAIGGISFGVVAMGGLTVALILAFGGLALAPVAAGGIGIGYLSYAERGFGFKSLVDLTRHRPGPAFWYLTSALWILCGILMAVAIAAMQFVKRKLRTREHGGETEKTGSADRVGSHTLSPQLSGNISLLDWRDRWIWDTGYVTLMFFAPFLISIILFSVLYPLFGAIGLLALLPAVLGSVFALVYRIVGNKVRRLKAGLSASDADMAEALIFERPKETPGLVLLRADRLELYGIALLKQLVIPLADIASISEVSWFNGTRLWWKCGFVIDLKDGRRVGFAIPEPFARRWREKLGLPSRDLPGVKQSVLHRELLPESTFNRWAQMITFGGALLIFTIGILRVTSLDLAMPQLIFGLLLVLILTLLIILIGFLLDPTRGKFNGPSKAGSVPAVATRRRGPFFIAFLLAAIAFVVLLVLIRKQGAGSLAFGPVVERMVNYSGPSSANCELDLDSSRLFTPPPNGSDWNWYLTNGIDLFGDPTDTNAIRLWAAGGTVITRATASAWTALGASQLSGLLAAVPPDTYAGLPLDALDELPATFAFKTREGGQGLLQIIGRANDSPGVRIQYKLVRDETVEVSPDQVIVKTPGFHGEGMLILFGPVSNRWEARHLDSLFAVTLKGHFLRHGVDWTIKRAHGNMGYLLESPNSAQRGVIVFHEGKPAPQGDGSYVIGEFQPDGGLPVPISIRLAQSEANANFVYNAPASLSPNVSEQTKSNRPNSEVLHVQIRQAQAEVDRLKSLVSIGAVTASDLEAAQDNLGILQAQLDGDSLKVAQIRVASAQRAVDQASMLVEIGTLHKSELEKAKAELEIRQAELRSLWPAGATNAVFGPVIERDVEGLIDFDTGKMLSKFPESITTSGDIAKIVLDGVDWMTSAGMDAVNSTTLHGVGMAAAPLATNDWDRITPQVLMTILGTKESARWQDLQPEGTLPKTWGFRTREGGCGVLQITGIASNSAIEVRYKLVQFVESQRAVLNGTNVLQFRWIARDSDPDSSVEILRSVSRNGSDERLRVSRDVLLSGKDVDFAGASEFQKETKSVLVLLTDMGARKFATTTAQNIGRQLAIVWNGRVISAPVIQSAITGGRVQVSGSFSDAEAQQLVNLLNHRDRPLPASTNSP